MSEEKQYYAFISYSHADKKEARELQHWLEYYKLPNNIRKNQTELPKYVRPVFRDTTNLEIGKLSPQIRNALDQSNYLIVICSPNAAKSQWVNDEIEYFISIGKSDKILPYIISGVPHADHIEEECYPKALLELSRKEEILGANVSEVGKDPAAIRIVAKMFNLRSDVLWHRFQREERKNKIIKLSSITIAVLFLLAFLLYVLYSNYRLKEENWKMLEMRGRVVSEKALQQLQNGEALLAASLMQEILPSDTNTLPYLNEYENVIYTICDSLENSLWKPFLLKGHYGEFMCSEFSLDGNLILSGSNDQSARIWDVKTGKEYTSLRMTHSNSIEHVAISPNKRYVLTQTLFEDSIFLWEINNNRSLYGKFIGIGKDPAFCDNENIMYKHVSVHPLYNSLLIEDGLVVCQLNNMMKDSIVGYYSVCYSNDNTHLAIIEEVNDSILHKNVGFTLKLITPIGEAIFKVPQLHITDVLFSPHNKYLAIKSNNKIDVIDLTSLTINQHILYDKNLYNYTFSNDDKYIVFSSLNNDENIVKFWNVKNGKIEHVVYFPWSVVAISFSQNGILFGGGGNGIGKLWNYKKWSTLKNNENIHQNCGDIRFFDNGKTVFEIKKDIINLITNQKEKLFCKLPICNTDIYKNNDYVAITTYDTSYHNDSSLYGTYTTNIYDIEGHQKFFIAKGIVAIASSNSYVITKEKEIYDYLHKSVIYNLHGHSNNITCGAFICDDKIAITGSYDHTVRFWDTDTGIEIKEKQIIIENEVLNIATSENPDFIYICDNKFIYVYNLKSSDFIKKIQINGLCEYMSYNQNTHSLECLIEREFTYPEYNGTYDIMELYIPSVDTAIKSIYAIDKYILSSEERRKYYLE